MARSSSLVGLIPKRLFKIDAMSPLWQNTCMIEQLTRGGGFHWHCSQCVSEYKNSYIHVKTLLCTIINLEIRVCPRLNKKGLPKEQIMAYIKEGEDATILRNRAKESHHPSNKVSCKPPSGFTASASPHPFISSPSSLENDNPFVSHKNNHWNRHSRMSREKL